MQNNSDSERECTKSEGKGKKLSVGEQEKLSQTAFGFIKIYFQTAETETKGWISFRK